MTLTESENQWEKLFQHLNYCVQILRKNLDQQKIEILKRVQHDIQILQKYIKSTMMYNNKRESEFEKLFNQLKKKEQEIQFRNSQIMELSCTIFKKDEEINKKQQIIENLKYSKKIDASYVSSILINQNSSLLKQLGKLQQKQNNLKQANSMDGFDLSEYSQHCAQQKIETQGTLTTTKSQIKIKGSIRPDFVCGVINQEEETQQQRFHNEMGESRELHKASSLIYGE